MTDQVADCVEPRLEVDDCHLGLKCLAYFHHLPDSSVLITKKD